MRNKLLVQIAFALVAISASSAIATTSGDATPNPHTTSIMKKPEAFSVTDKRALITILSYNVKGLPKVAGVTHDRFKDIGLELKKMREQNRQPAIVLLQEAFASKTKEIEEAADYKNVAWGPRAIDRNENNSLVIKPLNAGLRILSDYPIIKKSKVAYNATMCSSWDCFANKGAQVVQVQIPNIPFPLTIGNTHTQAMEGHDQVRISQFKVFQRFLTKFVPDGEPLFAIGDFNSWPTRTCYQHWCKETKMINVSDGCLKGEVPCNVILRENKGLDFNPDQHFFRNGKINGYDVSIRPVYAEHLFIEPVNGRLLSDHWGYNVTYEIKWEQSHALASRTE
jgi:endonuclease/exonuclease/phosphatase family metal-dependent hydrolase